MVAAISHTIQCHLLLASVALWTPFRQGAPLFATIAGLFILTTIARNFFPVAAAKVKNMRLLVLSFTADLGNGSPKVPAKFHGDSSTAQVTTGPCASANLTSNTMAGLAPKEGPPQPKPGLWGLIWHQPKVQTKAQPRACAGKRHKGHPRVATVTAKRAAAYLIFSLLTARYQLSGN